MCLNVKGGVAFVHRSNCKWVGSLDLSVIVKVACGFYMSDPVKWVWPLSQSVSVRRRGFCTSILVGRRDLPLLKVNTFVS